MDYRTHPISRKRIRTISKSVRAFFGYGEKDRIDPLRCLDILLLKKPNISYEVIKDNKLPDNVAAECKMMPNGGYKISIKETVYYNAYKGEGASRDHIMHEISHVILFLLGYTPLIESAYSNRELDAYESVEWQAKALCGETMIPYEETDGMIPDEIIKEYGVSVSQALYRWKMNPK